VVGQVQDRDPGGFRAEPWPFSLLAVPRVGWRADVAAAGLGLLSALALPPLHLLPVLLLAVPGLLLLIAAAPNARGALVRGFWFGFAHHLIGLYWVTDAILVEAERYWWLVPLAVPALAAVLAPFIAVACLAARLARPGWRRALALAGAWVLADLLRQFIATGFPWNPWGADWAVPGGFGDVFIQPAAWIGVHGLTLLTLLIAATPALGRRAMAGGVAALLVWAGFGWWRLSQPPPAAPGVEVVLVQGNIPQSQKHDRAQAVTTFERYLVLTRDGLAEARRLAPGSLPVAIWPESASPFLVAEDAGAWSAIAAAASGAPVLAGSVRFDTAERPRNSLVVVTGALRPTVIYDKWHLVPFGEYSPGWVPLAVQLVQSGFARGPGPQTLRVPGLPPLGALICYEAIFPGQVVDRADRPDWLVNITNDAWFGNSSGPRQHLAAARLRAVEEGLPLARAANTGISAVFDADGRERARLGIGVAGTVVTPLPGKLAATPFARFGLAIPAALATFALLTGLAGVPRTRGKRAKSLGF
jgi:apolipoprotein N-acyltransferase